MKPCDCKAVTATKLSCCEAVRMWTVVPWKLWILWNVTLCESCSTVKAWRHAWKTSNFEAVTAWNLWWHESVKQWFDDHHKTKWLWNCEMQCYESCAWSKCSSNMLLCEETIRDLRTSPKKEKARKTMSCRKQSRANEFRREISFAMFDLSKGIKHALAEVLCCPCLPLAHKLSLQMHFLVDFSKKNSWLCCVETTNWFFSVNFSPQGHFLDVCSWS